MSNSLFTVLFAYVAFFLLVLWLRICVEVVVDRIRRFGGGVEGDVDSINILPPPPPPPLSIFSLPTILCLTQVTDSYLKSVRA